MSPFVIQSDIYDKAGQYFLNHQKEDIVSVFNRFCDENNLVLKDTDALRIMDMFHKLSNTDEITIKNFIKYLEDKKHESN